MRGEGWQAEEVDYLSSASAGLMSVLYRRGRCRTVWSFFTHISVEKVRWVRDEGPGGTGSGCRLPGPRATRLLPPCAASGVVWTRFSSVSSRCLHSARVWCNFAPEIDSIAAAHAFVVSECPVCWSRSLRILVSSLMCFKAIF